MAPQVELGHPAPANPQDLGLISSFDVVEERIVSRQRETTRSWLAYSMVGLLAIIAMSTLAGIALGFWTVDEAEDIVTIVLSPVVSISATIIGFYFASSKR